MAESVIMPRLSLNEDTSLLSQWYVQEGDQVAAGDKLFCMRRTNPRWMWILSLLERY